MIAPKKVGEDRIQRQMKDGLRKKKRTSLCFNRRKKNKGHM